MLNIYQCIYIYANPSSSSACDIRCMATKEIDKISKMKTEQSWKLQKEDKTECVLAWNYYHMVPSVNKAYPGMTYAQLYANFQTIKNAHNRLIDKCELYRGNK